MKRNSSFIIAGLVFTGALDTTSTAQAGGISLYEVATPDVGLASAGYAARADDASTLFKNPAGMSRDGYSNAELISEIRYHYQGPFHFGAPDMMVVNLTHDQVWVRDGVLPDYPSMSPPKFDIAAMGGMLIPAPRNKREDFQEQSIRDAEISPDEYYPKGYKPELISAWPTTKPLFIPADQVPPGLWLKGKSAAAAQPATGAAANNPPAKN